MSIRPWPALVGAAAVLISMLPAGLAGQGPGRLQIDVSPTRVSFPTPGVADYEHGDVRAEGVTVSVETRGFAFWVLRIRSDDPDLGGYGKPLSDLQWRQPGGAWQAVAPGGDVVAFGFTSRQIELDFRTLLAWDQDPPDSYGAGITLQVTSLFGATGETRVGPAGAGPIPDDPAAVCARIAVQTRTPGRAELSSKAAPRSQADVERQCLDRLRERSEAARGGLGELRGRLELGHEPGEVGRVGGRGPGRGR